MLLAMADISDANRTEYIRPGGMHSSNIAIRAARARSCTDSPRQGIKPYRLACTAVWCRVRLYPLVRC
jgi:hypothetical protein